ncbi:MAG: hypothetical protein WC700_14400 [Gemmatimonadaceae bacterium]|jgi:hypothetical protein
MADPLWVPEHQIVDPSGSAVASPRVKASPLDKVKAEPRAPKEWVRRLRELWPVSDQMQWLQPRMFPESIDKASGYPIRGSARWVIYTMTPAALVQEADPTWVEMLDENPWWLMSPEKQFGRMMHVTTYQYAMWREYRCLARPYWCVQGDEGGTPMKYSLREKAVLKAENLPTDVPNPGDLPFATLDERVIRVLAERDKFRQLGGALDRLRNKDKAVADIKAEEAEAETVFRTEFVKWFKARMEPNAEFIGTHLRKSENGGDFRPATAAEANAADQWEDHYIATGRVPAVLPES